jgi:hypothetical protein
VSPWWTRPLPAWIEPGRAGLAGRTREAGAAGWREALAALDALLEETRPRALRLLLSGHFARLLMVPWDASLASAAERTAYLRHHFAEIYGGEEPGQWSLAFDRNGGAQQRLAVAVESALVEEAKALAARRKARLTGIEPLVTAELNRVRRSLPAATLFFGLLESQRACVLLLREGVVQRVASQRCAVPGAELERIVALERLDAGLAPQSAPLHVVERLAA